RDNWTETPERPKWREDYVTAAICQQFCDRTGASRAGNASNFASGRAGAVVGIPAKNRESQTPRLAEKAAMRLILDR
ncbi:hypothetical protein ONP46_22495, partial [Salmonella enterica subsp. enterica serovar Kentucky]|nr:hypothetical protein [Salmonella enterica subsp. enterica serovar Kentucky]